MPGRPRLKLTPEQIERRLSYKRPEYRDPKYVKRCPSCRRDLLARDHYTVCVSRYDGFNSVCRECDNTRRAERARESKRRAEILAANGATGERNHPNALRVR